MTVNTLVKNSFIQVTYTSCEGLKGLREPDGEVRVQCCRPSVVMAQTSEVLNRHRFETKSRFLSVSMHIVLLIEYASILSMLVCKIYLLGTTL